ncbi:hypothetical protein EON64_11020 [archaeon]|nr:MAG: hypothetical protein EON64_11020 [archaeon]
MLDSQYSALDSNNAIRPTVLNISPTWTKRAQSALLGKEQTSSLGLDKQGREKQKAFDLLDALTRSGGLELLFASLHVIVAATHGFEQDVLESVVCRNMNVIERVERSALILASTLHGKAGREVLCNEQVEQRLSTIWKGSPADRMLLLGNGSEQGEEY